jgi:hypothetical protein
VLLEALHEVGTQHAVRVGRPVVDLGGGHELAALREPVISTGLRLARAAYTAAV